MRRRHFLGTAAGAAWLLSGARARAQSFQQQITIGVAAPLSGPRSDAGLQLLDGVQAAINETNNTIGSFGTAYAYRSFDDQDALAQMIENAQFAAADPSIVAMIGGLDGKLTTAALPTIANAQMPLIVSASTANSITDRGYRNVWRLPTKDGTEGSLFARFLAKRARPKYAIAVTQDGDYGPDVAQGFRDQASALGIKADTYSFAWDKPDYGAAAKEIVAKKPDYLYLCGETKGLGPLIPALKAAGYAGSFGAAEGFFNQATLDKYADALGAALVSTSFPPIERAPDVANVLTDFRARATVTAISAFAYAAAQIVISASRRNNATNRLATLSALQTPVSYDTIVGSFQFSFTGDPIDPNLYFYTATGGTFKYTAASHPTTFLL
ncbi:MAG TPA: branched-chain amino acid ABC transporter substrate-binding protein [Candidatus Rubrimentiphilum sp.]|nr:branched-chain amino acid ABC transporter substrate-binding protein [Candidatus Rubrimentiphilum sp.]